MILKFNYLVLIITHLKIKIMEKKFSNLGVALSKDDQKKVQGGIDGCFAFAVGQFTHCMSFSGSTQESCTVAVNAQLASYNCPQML